MFLGNSESVPPPPPLNLFYSTGHVNTFYLTYTVELYHKHDKTTLDIRVFELQHHIYR